MVIAFEGLDGCFKSTVCELLKRTIDANQTSLFDSYSTYVKFEQFPRYWNDSSYFVRGWLKDNIFDREWCDPMKVVHPFYYLDRFAFWHEKMKSEVTERTATQYDIYKDGDPLKNIWIFDRYTWSSLTYQTAEYLIGNEFDIHEDGCLGVWVEKADELMHKMYSIESSLMPTADYVFWFWMPVGELDAINAMRKNAGPNDMNDNNVRLRNTIDWLVRRNVFGQEISGVDEQEPLEPYCCMQLDHADIPHVIKFDSKVIPVCVWDYKNKRPKSRMRILSEVMNMLSIIFEREHDRIQANTDIFNTAERTDDDELVSEESKVN